MCITILTMLGLTLTPSPLPLIRTAKTLKSRWPLIIHGPVPQGARWPSGLGRWTGDWVVLALNPAAATSLRNFGESVYPALPVYFGGDTKSRWSLLCGVYARGSKRSHQSALEMCNLLWTPHDSSLEKDNTTTMLAQRWAILIEYT